MIKILTECQGDYDLIKKIIEENKERLNSVYVDICKPEDSIAPVIWSIDDVRDHFPENTPDVVILEGFSKIEKQLKADMTERGWDTIDILKDVMTEDVVNDYVEDYEEGCCDED